MFNDSFIANFLQIVIVKEFQKSVSIWWSYAWNTPDSFFPDTVYNRAIILVFGHQGLLRKSDGFTPNGGTEYRGVAIFHQYMAISWKQR